MKEYWIDTQKWKIIRMMILQGSWWFEDFELEEYHDIFVWNNSWPRLSQLLKDGVVEVEKFENKNALYPWICKKARYRLKDEAISFYKKLYLINLLSYFNF